jgi:transcriptional regulator GlxA family with amidase domain
MGLEALHIKKPSDFREHISPVTRSHVTLRARRDSLTDRRIQVVLLLIEENFHEPLAIADVARAVNLSPGRLAHLFKSETGVAVQQYLTQIRLANAKHQLETSFLSVKEIAASVGFTSVNRFTTSFKSMIGMTPAQYRKRAVSSHLSRKDLVIAKSANE